jgi:hypothetical protein
MGSWDMSRDLVDAHTIRPHRVVQIKLEMFTFFVDHRIIISTSNGNNTDALFLGMLLLSGQYVEEDRVTDSTV